MSLHWLDYAVFGALLFASAIVGPIRMWLDRGKSTTAESYFMANRGLHLVPTSASLFASFFSASGINSLPLELYTGGAKFFMASVGQFVGIIFGAILIVPMFYNLHIMSAFKYFELRFNSPVLRKVGSVMMVIAITFQLGLVTFAPCIALATVTTVPLWLSVTLSASVTLIYTVLGGIRAVVVVDLIQAVIMFVGVMAAMVVGYMKVDGGFSRAMEVALEGGRLDFIDLNLDPRNTYSFYWVVFPAMIGAFQAFSTAQAATQRYGSLPTVKQAMISVMALAPQFVVLKLLLLFLAIAMFSHYQMLGCDPLRGKLISNPNQLVTYYVADILNYPGLMGLWFAALFSASLSTMSTMYNSVAAVVWADLLKEPLEKRLSPRGISLTIKGISLVIGVVSVLVAILFEAFKGSSVRLARATAGIFFSPLSIAFMSGIFVPFATAAGTVCGMISAVIFTGFLSSGQLMFKISETEQYWLPTRTDNCTAVMKAKLIFSSNNNTTTALTTSFLLLTSPASSLIATNSNLLSSSGNVNLTTLAPIVTPMMMNMSTTINIALNHGNNSVSSQPSAKNETFFVKMALNQETKNLTNISSSPENVKKSKVVLHPVIEYLFSLSYFLYPMLSLFFGVFVTAIASLCAGGLKMARRVEQKYLVVKNCFLLPGQQQDDEEMTDLAETKASGQARDVALMEASADASTRLLPSKPSPEVASD